MVIDVKPATTLAEAADQMEEAMSMCADHYIPVCDVVLSNWSMVCRSVDVDALMALADEMKRDTGRVDELQLGIYGACYLSGMARRISEALGVEHG